MTHVFDEQLYPVTFRKDVAQRLGNSLAGRNSVELIGMKRVGISNFLRFFLHHEDIVRSYIHQSDKHIFIPVDLNDMVEIEVVPFWTLTFKRVVDIINRSPDLEPFRERANDEFLRSIQMQDLFYTVDSLRDVLADLSKAGFFPTLFFIRFDRLQHVVTQDLFRNLQGLVDATGQRLAYVFTGFRELHDMAPEVFHKASLAAFTQKIYLEPASMDDMAIIMETLLKKFKITLTEDQKKELLIHSGGHAQYVQLSLIILHEMMSHLKKMPGNFVSKIAEEERITLQSEELFAVLNEEEQRVLLKVFHGEVVSDEERMTTAYLWNTGYVKKNGSQHVFSPLFASYLEHMENYHNKAKVTVGLTKKEQLLYTMLHTHKDEICEREDIIQAVWPECNEIGVSDWALDRLVSRLRNKLKLQQKKYEIQTIKTRGFKLAEK